MFWAQNKLCLLNFFNPQIDGQTKIVYKILEYMLRHYVVQLKMIGIFIYYWLSLHTIMFGNNQFKPLLLC